MDCTAFTKYQNLRLELVRLLIPAHANDAKALIDAATSLEEHVLGRNPLLQDGTGDKE